MSKFSVNSSPEVVQTFNNYPDFVKVKLLYLRSLILEVANDTDDVETLDEVLKWGEPSYVANKGSTLRIDWKSKTPDQYMMYFKCTSRLVETFKTVFKDQFNYENNRAIIFKINDEIPIESLKACIKATLTYHKVKHLSCLCIEV